MILTSSSPIQVVLLLTQTRIDDVLDPGDGDTRLGDVGSEDDLPRSRRSRFEDLGLLGTESRSHEGMDRDLKVKEWNRETMASAYAPRKDEGNRGKVVEATRKLTAS